MSITENKNFSYVIDDCIWFFHERNEIYYDTVDGAGKSAININAPASRCLRLLLENKHKIVKKECFFDHVWKSHGCFVSQNTYYKNISLLRRYFKKAKFQKEIIITISKEGLMINKDVSVRKEYISLDDIDIHKDDYKKNTTTCKREIVYDESENFHALTFFDVDNSTLKHKKFSFKFNKLINKYTLLFVMLNMLYISIALIFIK